MIKEWICDLRNFFLTPLVQSSGHWGQFQGTCGFVGDLYMVAQFLVFHLMFSGSAVQPSGCRPLGFLGALMLLAHLRREVSDASPIQGEIRVGTEWHCRPQRGRACGCRPLSKIGGLPGCNPQHFH